MTKHILFFSLALLISVTIVKAQNSSTKNVDRNSIVSLYPFAFTYGNFKLGFEQRLSDASTIKVIPSLGLADHSNFYNLEDYFGFSVEGMLKYFPMKKSPNGFYGGVYLIYKYAEGKRNTSYYDANSGYYSTTLNNEGSARAFGGGVCVGGQFNIKNVVFIDLYFGGGPIVPDSKYFFPDHSTDFGPFFGSRSQIMGFSRGITGHSGISFGIPLR